MAGSKDSVSPPASGVENKTVRQILPPAHVLQDKLHSKLAVVPRADAAPIELLDAVLEADEPARAPWSPPESAISKRETREAAEAVLVAGAANDSVGPSPSSSGVRVSEGRLPSAGALESPESPLTFTVYTLEDLERRSDAPASMRMSCVSLESTATRRWQHWQRAAFALRAFALASLEWIKIKGQRPDPRLALRKPFDDVGDELQVAVESFDWKKLGVKTGIVVGATLTLLFAVLTAAELTDDFRPGAAAHMAPAQTARAPEATLLDAREIAPATNMAAMGVQPVAAAPAPAPAAAAAPAVPTPIALGDLDDDAPARVKRPARKAAPKPKASKLTMRTAPF